MPTRHLGQRLTGWTAALCAVGCLASCGRGDADIEAMLAVGVWSGDDGSVVVLDPDGEARVANLDGALAGAAGLNRVAGAGHWRYASGRGSGGDITLSLPNTSANAVPLTYSVDKNRLRAKVDGKWLTFRRAVFAAPGDGATAPAVALD